MRTLKPNFIRTPTGIQPVEDQEWAVLERAWLRLIEECQVDAGASDEAYQRLKKLAHNISEAVGPSTMSDLLMYGGVPHEEISVFHEAEWDFITNEAAKVSPLTIGAQ
jgi:hypothetical protein